MADVSGKFFSAKKVRTGVSPSSPGVEQGETLPPVNPPGTSLNSVGLTMPTAFNVANSPLTSNGTIAVTGAGTTDQYVRGDGSLQNFPSLTGYVPYTGATADVDLGTHDLTAERGTFANNGSSDTLTVNHTSGSGYGVKVTKGGNNEALLVTKTSGSGNAMAVVGGRTALVDLSLSSVSNATGNFLTISGGVVHQRTPSETRSDVGAQAQLNGTGFVKASGTTITYDNSTYQLTSEKGQPNGYASLDSNGKVPLTQINDALIGNVNYQGLWNAATNNPTLVNPPSSGTKGYYYIVSTAGTFASISFEVGDWIISNGSAWQKVDNTDAVSSVFGRTGNVIAANGDYNTSQVTENTNLYYTEARVSANTDVAANTAARHAAVTLGTANGLSLNTQQLSLGLASAGVTGALSGTDWSTFNSKQQALNGTGFVKISGTTISYDNSTYYLASNPSAFIALTALSGTAPIEYNNTTGAISITQASGSTNGFLSSTDWNTFNSKQQALNGTGFVKISGTTISYDNSTYLTGNQTITLSGDATGSGATAITVVLANSGVTAGTYNDSATQVRPFTVDAKGRITSIGTAVTITPDWANISGQRTLTRDDAGLQGNAGARSGFFETVSPVNYYSGANSWQHLIESRHTNDSNNYAMQIAGSFFDQEFYVRKTNNSATTAWSKLWHSGNITPVTGTGETNYLPKFTGTSTIGNSIINESGTAINVAGNLSVRGDWNTTYPVYQMIDTRVGGAGWNIENGRTLGNLSFYRGSTLMTLDASGNLGVGVTPSAWNLYKAIQVQNASISNFDNSDNSIVGSNVFYGGSPNDFRYISTGTSTVYRLNNSVHSWFTAPLGTAGDAISFTQAMTLGSNSGLSIGTPSAAPAQGLLVQGEGRFSDNLIVSKNQNNSTAISVSNTTSGSLSSANFVATSSNGFLFIGKTSATYTTYKQIVGNDTSIYNGTSGDISILNDFATGNIKMAAGASSTAHFTIASSGAATFSSSVTASRYTSIASSSYTNDFVNTNIGTVGQNIGLRFGYDGLTYNKGAVYFISKSANGVGDLIFALNNSESSANVSTSDERMRITSAGNVGIGTISPTQKLEVNGVIESYYLEFKPVVFYDFNSDTTGDWGKNNSTLSVPNDSVTRYTSTGPDSNINKSFNFDGGQNQIIRIRYKVVSGIAGGGEIFYVNSQHSFDASYFKGFNLVSDGAWHTLVLDMSSLTAGGTDWIDYNVTQIRFDLTNSSGVVIDIDWIAIGGNGYGTQYFENDVAFMNGNVGIATTTPNSRLQVNGSVSLPHTTKSANYTLTDSDYTVGFDCASNRTATLPDATTCAGRIYVIYQYNTATGGSTYVTLDGNGSQTIDGVTTYSLQYNEDFSSVMIQSTGSNWVVIAYKLYPSPL